MSQATRDRPEIVAPHVELSPSPCEVDLEIALAVAAMTASVTHPNGADTSSAVAARYVQIGKALKGSSDELWARYRLIRINDALKTEASRRETNLTLAEIERAIGN